MLASLPPFNGRYPMSESEADATEDAASRLSVPADRKWIAQRVVCLLTHYFVADFHPSALENVALDWTAELDGYPEWAIEKACQWWVSKGNKKRGKKPLPGDISERAEVEMAPIKAGKYMVSAFRKYGETPPEFLRK